MEQAGNNGTPGGAAPSDAKPQKPISPTRRRANSLVKSAKKLASAAVAAATGKKAAKKKRPRSGSMEGSPRAAAAAAATPPPLPQAPHPEFDRRPTPKPGEGRPPRPPDRREAAPRGLRKLAAVLDRLLLAHSVDDVVEEFFVTGLDAQRDGRQAAGARLDAEALRRACQLHGGKLREAEAQAAVAALGANGAVSVSALLHFCEDRKRRLDGDTASESTVASATPPPPPLPGRHGSQGWLFDAADRAPAPAPRARAGGRAAAAPRRDGLRRRLALRADPVRVTVFASPPLYSSPLPASTTYRSPPACLSRPTSRPPEVPRCRRPIRRSASNIQRNDPPNSKFTIVGRRDHLCTSSGPEEPNSELA